MKTATRYQTPHEIVSAGFESLVERLGPDGAIRFMLQYEQGKGDYTKERTTILDNLTRFINIPRKKRIESVKRHRDWQRRLDKEKFVAEVFGN